MGQSFAGFKGSVGQSSKSSCTKLVATADLIQESGWETLSERRRKHKLILFYKMVNGLSPSYLNILVPLNCLYKRVLLCNRSFNKLLGYFPTI